MLPFDTKPEIAAMQARLQDSMSGEERVILAFEMSHYAHELAKQYLRDQHPEWSEMQAIREYLRSLFPPGKAPQGF